VEDELLIALQLESELTERGYRSVGPAQSLEEGLDLTRSERFDAALLDINLGQDSSLPIAEELTAAGTPFAFMTGYSDTLLIPPHLRTIPAIRKPFQVESLLGLLQELVARPAAGRAARSQPPGP
jgi:DNA-binding response OmpR family regulator